MTTRDCYVSLGRNYADLTSSEEWELRCDGDGQFHGSYYAPCSRTWEQGAALEGIGEWFEEKLKAGRSAQQATDELVEAVLNSDSSELSCEHGAADLIYAVEQAAAELEGKAKR